MRDVVEIRAFEPFHFEGEALRDGISCADTSPEYLLRLKQAGPAWSLFVDGKLVCCIGLGYLFRGVAEVWSLMTPRADSYGRILHRICKIIDEVQRDLELHRIQCNVLAGSERNIKWALSLGFCPEGLAKWMGPNKEDMIRFAKLMEV